MQYCSILEYIALYRVLYLIKTMLSFHYSAGGDCAHVLAVVLKLTDWVLEGMSDVPSQPACTSVPQQWDKPRGTRIEAEPVCTMVISKPGNTDRKKRPLTADFSDNRYSFTHYDDVLGKDN